VVSYDLQKLNSPLYALACLAQAFTLLTQSHLRPLLFWPLLINLLLFPLALVASSFAFLMLLENLLPPWPDWLTLLLFPLFALTLLAVICSSFALVANLIGSPFYSHLTIQVEQLVTGRKPQTVPLGKLVRAELRRWRYYLKGAVPLLLLTPMPLLGAILPPFWLLWQAWFLGLEYTAYPLQGRGVPFPEMVSLLRGARLGVMTLGGAIMVGLTVPLLNILMPPIAVIAATLYLIEAERPEPHSEPK